MGTTFKRLGLSELLPRYIFAEGLYARRRVLEVGAVATTQGESARFLLTRGARTVLSCDSDLAAVEAANKAHTAQGLRYRANVFDDLEGGSFDVVMVADLAPYVRAPELLRELTRLLGRGGLLIGGLRNPAGLALSMVMEAEDDEAPPTWGQLLDALSSHFPSVEVATQSPVLGYQLAFERGDGLQVDGSLAEATEAAYFVAIAAQEPVRAVDPTWVQLPPEPLAYTGGKLEESARRGKEWQERTERMKELLERAKKDLSTKENDLKDVREHLLGAREGVARLTVQLEEFAKRPKALEQQDELASRIRRLEAELGVARERAQDAEGRVHAARAESEAQTRAQKDAAVEAIAAQEMARLERSRREELVTQLEDARTRLASAYEQHGKLQDELANGRVELERTRLQADRVVEALSGRERELATAKEREVKLAEGRSEALSAIEVLEGQLDVSCARSGEALAQLERKESERLAAMRSAELESQSRLRFEQGLTRTQAELAQAQAVVQKLEEERPGFDTEIQEARAASHRLTRDIEVLAGSERTWRAMAQEFEQRLANTQANVEALSEQLSQAEAATGAETSRYRRLEKDLSTAVGAERSAREQAEVALAQTRHEVASLTEQSQALEERRSSIAGQAGELAGRVKNLEEIEAALVGQLDQAETRGEQWALERAQLTAGVEEAGSALAQSKGRVADLEIKLDQLTSEAAAASLKGTDIERLLQARVDALTPQLQSRTAERDEHAAQLQQVAAELVEEEARAQSLEADLGELKALLDSTGAQANERQTTIDELRERLEESERRFQTIDAALHAQISALEETGREQAAEAADEQTTLEQMLREGQSELERTRQEYRQNTSAIVAEHHAKLASLAERNEQARHAHQSRLAALTAEYEQAQKDQQHKATAQSAEEQQVRHDEIAALTGAHEQARREDQQRVDARTAEHEQVRRELQQRLDALVEEFERSKNENRQKSGAISSELEAAQQKNRQEVEALATDLAASRQKHQAELEAMGGDREATRLKLQREVEALAADLEATRREHQQEVEIIAGELSVARAEQQQSQAHATELEQTRAELQRKTEGTAAELEQTRTELQRKSEGTAAELEQTRTELRQKTEASAAELEQVRTELRQKAEASAAELEQARTELGQSSEAKAAELEQVRADFRQKSEASAVELEQALRRASELSASQLAQLAAELEKTRAERSHDGEQARAQLGAAQIETQKLKAELELALRDVQLNSGELATARQATEQLGEALKAELLAATTSLADLESKLHNFEGEVAHLQAEVAEGVDARLAEQELRQSTEFKREEVQEQLAALGQELQRAKDEADQATAAGRSEAEQLSAQLLEVRTEAARKLELATVRLVSATADLSQARERQEQLSRELQKAQAEASELQTLTPTLVKAREEASAKNAALEEAIAHERAAAQTNLQTWKATHLQQLIEHDTIAQRAAEEAAVVQRKALDDAAAGYRLEVEAREAAHRQELDSRSAEAQKALTHASEAQRVEFDSLKEQFATVKEDREKWRGTVERAQSEARGHQSGKLGLQKELEKIREELAKLRASSAIAGGESQAMGDAREQTEKELVRLRARLAVAEAELPRAQQRRDELEAEQPRVRAAKDELDAELQKTLAEQRETQDALSRAKEDRRATDEELARARDRSVSLEAELSAVRGSAQGSSSDFQLAIAARRQAEELLLGLRTKYGELQDMFQHVRTAASDIPRLKEEVLELKAEAAMLEAERERLSSDVERLEGLQPTEQTYALGAGDLAAELAMSQEAVVDRDARLEALLKRVHSQDAELAALTKKGTSSPIARIALVKKSVLVPVAALPPRKAAPPPPPRPSAPTPPSGIDLEVFELDIDEDQKHEGLLDDMQILDDDEPLTPVKK